MARVLLRELATGEGDDGIGRLSLEVGENNVGSILGDRPRALRRLVRALAGLEPIREGAFLLDGIDVTDTIPERRNVAVVFAGGALFPHLDVAGNIGIGLEWRGIAKADRDTKVQAAAALLGFETRLGLPVDRLTAADRVRVGLARALVKDPALVVLEDVFADVETSERGLLRADVARALRKSRRTALVTTRDPGEAFAMGEQVAIVHDGLCVQTGAPVDLARSPANLAVARATGALVVHAGAQDRRVVVGGVALELPADRASVAVVLPFEDLSLEAGPLELRGTVELVQPLPPSEASVVVRVQGESLAFRVPREKAPRLGDELVVRADPGSALFFDPATGARLGEEPVPERWIPPAPPGPAAGEVGAGTGATEVDAGGAGAGTGATEVAARGVGAGTGATEVAAREDGAGTGAAEVAARADGAGPGATEVAAGGSGNGSGSVGTASGASGPLPDPSQAHPGGDDGPDDPAPKGRKEPTGEHSAPAEAPAEAPVAESTPGPRDEAA